MAISQGQVIGLTQVDSSGTSASASFATAPSAGSLVTVEIFGWHGSAFDLTSVTDNQGNTYTLLKTVTASKSVGGASTTRGCIAYAYNVASSGTFTITINGLGSGSYFTWGAQSWTGVATSSAADQSAQAESDSSSPVAVTTGTTTQADELVVAVLAAAGRTTNAGIDDPPSGYTSLFAQQDYTNHNAGEACYKIISATGAQTASWAVSVLAGDFECDANIITFKAAGGGGTTNLSLSATAVGVPRIVREVRLTERASDVGVPRVVREVRLTERAGAVGTAAMSLLRVTLVTLAATAVGTARMTKQAQLVLAAASRGTGAVVKKALLNLAGQARGTPAVTRSVAMRLLGATAVGAVTVALLEISTILAAVTAAGVAAMSMIVYKIMASSAVVTPALSTSATVAERVVGRLTGQAGLGLYLKAKAGWRRRRSNWKPRGGR